ncbi:hypothetical protein ABH926_000569 [Catenulispora sp. GP43]
MPRCGRTSSEGAALIAAELMDAYNAIAEDDEPLSLELLPEIRESDAAGIPRSRSSPASP